MRTFIGIVAGIAAALLVSVVLPAIGDLLFPSVVRVDLSRPERLFALFGELPFAMQLVGVAAFAIAPFAAAAVAKWLSGRTWAAWVASLYFVLNAVVAGLMLPVPLWMRAICIVGGVAGAWLGSRVRPRTPAAAEGGDAPA